MIIKVVQAVWLAPSISFPLSAFPCCSIPPSLLFSCSSLWKGLSRSSDATGGRKVVSALQSHHCTTNQQCCGLPALDWDYRHRVGMGLGEPAARGSPFISGNSQKLGSFGFFHQYAWKDDAQPTSTPTPPTLPGIRLTFFFLQQDGRPCKTAVQHRRDPKHDQQV